jgi:hypothetical protein
LNFASQQLARVARYTYGLFTDTKYV